MSGYETKWNAALTVKEHCLYPEILPEGVLREIASAFGRVVLQVGRAERAASKNDTFSPIMLGRVFERNRCVDSMA